MRRTGAQIIVVLSLAGRDWLVLIGAAINIGNNKMLLPEDYPYTVWPPDSEP